MLTLKVMNGMSTVKHFFNPNIEDDVNYKKMIGFIEKVKLALQDCVEINGDLK